MVQLRNDVVHKGKLATKNEAENFGKYVFEYITTAAKKLQEHIPYLLILQIKRLARQCEKDFEKEANDPIFVSHSGETSILATGSLKISCLLNNPEIKVFEDCLRIDFKNKSLGLI